MSTYAWEILFQEGLLVIINTLIIIISEIVAHGNTTATKDNIYSCSIFCLHYHTVQVCILCRVVLVNQN